MATIQTPRGLGFAEGIAAARNAWIGNRWTLQVSIEMPNRHLDRQEFIAGFAAGMAEYNRSITVGE